MSGTQLRKVLRQHAEHQHSPELEAQVEQLIGSVESGAGSVDEHAWTPARFITVFFPEFFRGPFVDHHGDIILVLLALTLSVIAFRDRYQEIEEKELENRGDRFIIQALAERERRREKDSKDKDNKDKVADAKLDQKQADPIFDKIREGLKKVAKDLFIDSTVELIINDPNTNGYDASKPFLILNLTSSEKKKKEKDSLTNSVQDFLDRNKIAKLTVNFIKNLWYILSNYALYYWIVWFFAVFLISSSIYTVPLGLTLAAVIPVLYLLVKFGLYIQAKVQIKPKIEENNNTKFKKQMLLRAYVDKLIHDDLMQHEKLNIATLEKDAEEKAEDNLDVEKQAENLFRNLFVHKKLLILTTALSSLVSGYIVATFIQWPLTDFLVSVVHISAVGTGAGLSFAAVLLVFGIALAIGLTFAIMEGIKKNDKIEKSKAIAIEFLEKNEDFLKTKKEYEKRITKVHGLLSGLEPASQTFWKDLLEKADLLEQKTSLFERFRRRLAMFITGAGSGIFVIRTLLLAGCIVPLFLGPLSWSLILSVAIATGVVWGLFKVATMIHAKEEARELEMIKTMPHLALSYKDGIKLLRKMEAGIRADIQVQLNTAAPPKRAAPRRVSSIHSPESTYSSSMTTPLLRRSRSGSESSDDSR